MEVHKCNVQAHEGNVDVFTKGALKFILVQHCILEHVALSGTKDEKTRK